MKITSEQYLKAAKLINQKGHCKYQFKSPDGRYCIAGAVMQTINKKKTIDSFYEALDGIDVLKKDFRSMTGKFSMYAWNDEKERTKKEVVTTLKDLATFVEKESDA